MLGFSDLDDLQLITATECARRMGYGSVAACRRALRRKGASLPRAFLRGKYRAADLKDWFLALDAAQNDGAFRRSEGKAGAAAVLSMEAARRRLRRNLAALG